MLAILTKKRFGFQNGPDERFETQGNSIIENAPEWITKTDLYKMAMEEGSIIEVKAGNTAKAEKKADKKK